MESPVLDETARQKMEKLPGVTEAFPDIRFITSLAYDDKPHLTMGVSTIASYRGSQLFEVLGLTNEVCDEFFPDAACVRGGKTFDALIEDYLANHLAAHAGETAALTDAGLYRFRKNGEQHLNSPELVRRMHRYIKAPSDQNLQSYRELAGQRGEQAIRDLVDFKRAEPLAVQEVETEASLLSRFSTQAMRA